MVTNTYQNIVIEGNYNAEPNQFRRTLAVQKNGVPNGIRTRVVAVKESQQGPGRKL